MREEYLGTLITGLFDIVVFIIIYMLWTISSAPKILIVAGTLVFGGVAIWATVKVCIYWFNKIKQKWNLKRKQ